VKVIVRLRPPMDQGISLAYSADEEDVRKLLGHFHESHSPHASVSPNTVEELEFSRVVGPRESTKDLYNALGLRESIAGIAQGFQETVFAYGQTGSGKTHTILGSASELGVLQLSAQELFQDVFGPQALQRDEAADRHRRVQLVCLEIKNDDVSDLLPADPHLPPACQEADVICHKGKRHGFRRVTVWSYDEAMALLQRAIASREVGSSHVNSESSRSHMVVRFLVKTLRAPKGRLADGVVGGLTLVDLAGNERDSSSPNGTAINVSLTHLNRMLVKMQDRELDESDRRQSALNMVLYEQLREDCGVTMIFCVHPDRRFAGAARSTLQMASLCRRIVQRKRVRRIEDSTLKEELVGLRDVMREHREAHAAQMAKEEELQKAREVLKNLKLRYEEKSKDYEALKKNLELEFHRVSSEGREKAELELRNEELIRKVAQLQKQVQRQADESPAVLAALPEIHTAGESFEDHRQELQRAYKHELHAVHEAYKKQLRTLQEALKIGPPTPTLEKDSTKGGISSKSSSADEAGLVPPVSFSSWAFADLGVQSSIATSSSAEPCSEPSMHSGFTGEEGHEPGAEAGARRGARRHAEAPKSVGSATTISPLSPRRVLQVASPQRAGLAGAPVSQPEKSGPVPPVWAGNDGKPLALLMAEPGSAVAPASPQLLPRSPGSTTTLQVVRERGRGRSPEGHLDSRCAEYGKAPLFSPPAHGRSVTSPQQSAHSQGSSVEESMKLLLTAQPQTLAEVEAIEDAASRVARLALHGKLPQHLQMKGCIAGTRVMHLLPQSAQAQRDGAILLSELANKDASARAEIASRGAVGLAVSTLRWLTTTSSFQKQSSLLHQMSPPQQYSEACSGCFRLLAVLCQRNAVRQAHATEVGGLQSCLQCMSQPMLRSHDTAIHGCWLLMALCHKHPGNQEFVRLLGGVSLVMQLLQEQVATLEEGRRQAATGNITWSCAHSAQVDPRAATLCAYAAGFLAIVAEGNDACRLALCEAGGVALLMRTLDLCIQSPHVVANACVAVSHLAYLHSQSQLAARAQGGVMSILRAMLAYRGNGPVQGSICRAVAVLSEGPCVATQQAFLAARVADGDKEMGAVLLLVHALRDLPQDAALVTTASWALSNLIAESPEAIEHVCSIGGTSTAVALLKSSVASTEHACQYLCRLLCCLAGGVTMPARRCRLELQRLGALEGLRMAQQQHANSRGDVLPAIFRALQALEVCV